MEKIYERCLRCGRKLKTEKAKIAGYGTVCLKKVANENFVNPLFKLSNEVKTNEQ